ncbi:MAG: hypothetical protein Q7K57_48660 [Burkholderiaceae bacterium]|nr:hypothetical protein [Burkholderiaceae bacterium]
MPLPTQTLAVIQTAGAAIYAADTALKEAVQSYADQVKLAMTENPFDMGNDSLFEDWKTVARLSRAVGQVEAEFQKIYGAATDLSAGAIPAVLTMPSLTAPQAKENSELAMVQEIDATDAVIKKSSKRIKAKAKTKPAARKQTLSGNSAKVLTRLLEILNPNDFLKINLSAIGAEIGLPKGSIGASIAKLIDTGHLIAAGVGEYKLGTPRAK